MRDLAEFFARLNDTAFPYVVLRNWENLPYAVETGPHSDLDLLVYDFDHFMEFNPDLERVYSAPRVQFKLYFDDLKFVQIDVRYIGDRYYPEIFEANIIGTREWNPAGFWTPNPIHHKIGLVYHCVHHKNANNYPKFLGKLEVPEMLETLKQNKEFTWVEPLDPTVGRFNKYVKGATSIVEKNPEWVEKKQYRYMSYNLVDNEERILKLFHSKHFPKLLGRTEDMIRIKNCGEPLRSDNLPDNWHEQLLDILTLLDDAGVVHRDVRKDNLMVKDGVIKLIDFGWAKMTDEPDNNCPSVLGQPNKCPLGFNDRYSMSRVIKQILYEKESVCVS